TEYQAVPYLRRFWCTQRFDRVMYRRQLERTRPARLLLWALRLGMLLEIAAGAVLLLLGLDEQVTGGAAFGLALIIGYPVVWAHLAVVPLVLGRILVIKPKQALLIQKSKLIFS